VKHLNSGAFGAAYLERDCLTGEAVAIKYIPRGATARGAWPASWRLRSRWGLQINKNVQRETVSHRLLSHPNVIAFKKARGRGTPSSLALPTPKASHSPLALRRR